MIDPFHKAIYEHLDKTERKLWDIAQKGFGLNENEKTEERFIALLKHVQSINFGDANERDTSAEEPDLDEWLLALGIYLTRMGYKHLHESEPMHALEKLIKANYATGLLERGIEKEEIMQNLLSSLGKKAATARHAEHRDLKAQALEYYAANKDAYASKDEAAQALTKIVAVKFSTARHWLKNQ